MGVMVVEQRLQSAVVRIDDAVDRKKKRRSRRSKQNSSLNGSASIEVSLQHQQEIHSFQHGNMSRNGSSLQQHGANEATNVAFNSPQMVHLNDQGAKLDPRMNVYSQSCPTPNIFGESSRLNDDRDFIPPYHDRCNKQKHFDSHWSPAAIEKALERGEVFRATLRVNAHNRLEAYCTIEGAPMDVLISGIPFQNRAVEGDVVAVKVDPPSLWSRMKGSHVSANCSFATDDVNSSTGTDITHDSLKGKDKMDVQSGPLTYSSTVFENGFSDLGTALSDGTLHQEVTGRMNNIHVNGHHHTDQVENAIIDSSGKLCQAITSSPSKRPTGRVVGIIEPSSRRNSVIGFLNVKWWLSSREGFRTENRTTNMQPLSESDYIHFLPNDPKFPKMIVPLRSLPDIIMKKLNDRDSSIENELVAARIDRWAEESSMPQACVTHVFGNGGEMEPRMASILSEHNICCSEFSPESLACLPHELWQVSHRELERRKDIRDQCVFTIDPSTATDLDDALSVEKLPGEVYRVGVHISDVSYFVQPDTALDLEAKKRLTSVYMGRSKLPMLPPMLSENFGSLTPGVDRLAYSIFWDVSVSGDILDQWVGRTVIRSCCQLSYEHAQDIIEGKVDADSLNSDRQGFPQLHGHFDWRDIFEALRTLHDISVTLRNKRINDGALRLDIAKVAFLLDEFGVPYDSLLCERKDSNFLVEEFMLLANRTAAEIITRAYPDSALLRRHPKPKPKSLEKLVAFCNKYGFEFDTTSSGSISQSLDKLKEKLKDDPVLYDILINYAVKSMQLAIYFCSGDSTVGEDDRGHYALAVPLYTHFTSPLRRYPDIVVHRSLTAAIEAEQMYLNHKNKDKKYIEQGNDRCFTGIHFDKLAAQSVEGQQALAFAALKHKLPEAELLSHVAMCCNFTKLASRRVKDDVDKLYMCHLLKNKQILFSEARVLSVGPRFMSIYVQKLGAERHIEYDDVEGLMVEWLVATSTLVLSYRPMLRPSQRRGNPNVRFKSLEEVALLDSPCNILGPPQGDAMQNGNHNFLSHPNSEIPPAFFPLTIRVFSTIPVALDSFGGESGSLGITARLYVSSYFI